MGNNNHKFPTQQFVPPPAADLSDKDDAEVWLDLVTSALKGYCGAAWAKDKGPVQMVTAGVASRAAVECADAVLAEYKKRRK